MTVNCLASDLMCDSPPVNIIVVSNTDEYAA